MVVVWIGTSVASISGLAALFEFKNKPLAFALFLTVWLSLFFFLAHTEMLSLFNLIQNKPAVFNTPLDNLNYQERFSIQLGETSELVLSSCILSAAIAIPIYHALVFLHAMLQLMFTDQTKPQFNIKPLKKTRHFDANPYTYNAQAAMVLNGQLCCFKKHNQQFIEVLIGPQHKWLYNLVQFELCQDPTIGYTFLMHHDYGIFFTLYLKKQFRHHLMFFRNPNPHLTAGQWLSCSGYTGTLYHANQAWPCLWVEVIQDRSLP